MATVKRVITQLCDDLYDNGTPGLITRTEAFMSEAAGIRLERQRVERAHNLKLNALLVIVGVLALVLSATGIIVAWYVSEHHADIMLPKISHSNSPQEAVNSEQSAQNPNLVER